MSEKHDIADGLPADLTARLWAIEHVLESVVIWYWRARSEHYEIDWRPDARAHIKDASHAGLTWVVDQGLEPGQNPEMEALVTKHVKRLYEHTYRRIDLAHRRIGGGDSEDPPEG